MSNWRPSLRSIFPGQTDRIRWARIMWSAPTLRRWSHQLPHPRDFSDVSSHHRIYLVCLYWGGLVLVCMTDQAWLGVQLNILKGPDTFSVCRSQVKWRFVQGAIKQIVRLCVINGNLFTVTQKRYVFFPWGLPECYYLTKTKKKLFSPNQTE